MKQSINEKRAENTFEKSLENAGDMMNYKGYIGKVEYDDENDIFTGSVINVRTVITFLGSTFDEIEKEFKASVDVTDQSGQRDLNSRPHGPQPCALPSYAIPRNYYSMTEKTGVVKM